VATVELGVAQPFESRQGVDVILTLRFHYNPELVALVKRAGRGPAQHRVEPGRLAGGAPVLVC